MEKQKRLETFKLLAIATTVSPSSLYSFPLYIFHSFFATFRRSLLSSFHPSLHFVSTNILLTFSFLNSMMGCETMKAMLRVLKHSLGPLPHSHSPFTHSLALFCSCSTFFARTPRCAISFARLFTRSRAQGKEGCFEDL